MDIESIIIKHPESQPRQIHNQKNDDFPASNIFICNREK